MLIRYGVEGRGKERKGDAGPRRGRGGREVGLREQLKEIGANAARGAVDPNVEVTAQRSGRFKTGMARLDDLLFGGFPMNANLLFVGPAFVGKEVAVLNFIAEGLRSSVPAGTV